MRWTTVSPRVLAAGLLAGLSGCALLFNFNDYDDGGGGGGGSGSRTSSSGVHVGGSGGSGGPGGGAPSSVSSGSGIPVPGTIQIGGTLNESLTWMDVDTGGNIVIAGVFTGTINIGGMMLKPLNNMNRNLFLAKFDPDGAPLWAKLIASSPTTGLVTAGLAVNPADNSVVIAGGFGSKLESKGLSPEGGPDGFVEKYTKDGLIEWSHTFPGTGTATATAAAVDSTGQVVVTGRFSGFIAADDPMPCTPLDAGVNEDAFVAKLDTNTGKCMWLNRTGSSMHAHGDGVAIDMSNVIYVSGAFKGDINPGMPLVLLQAQAPQGDTFVVKYGPNGNPLYEWLLAPAGDATITIDPMTQSLLLSGTATGAPYDGPNETYVGLNDMLAAKYDMTNTISFAKLFGGTGADSAHLVATADGSGHLIMGGAFEGTVTIGANQLNSVGGRDAFIATLDDKGAPITAKRFGDALQQEIRFVRVHPTKPGTVVAAGVFQGAIDLGNGPLVSNGGYDIFVYMLPVSSL